jgi:anti-anti-sigma regulatory factor
LALDPGRWYWIDDTAQIRSWCPSFGKRLQMPTTSRILLTRRSRQSVSLLPRESARPVPDAPHHRGVAPAADPSCWCDDSLATVGAVEMRVRCRHRATVLRISGNLDASSVDRASADAARQASLGTALILDLADLNSPAEHAMSLLIAVDEACAAGSVPWVLVPSRAVGLVLRRTGCDDVVVTAGSVPAAMRLVADLARARRRVLPATRGVRR